MSLEARPRLHALLTVHNRMRETLSCLERLAAQSDQAGAEVRVVLVDDGSTDGTGAAVRARFPDVQVVEGSGQLYWNGGMRRAFEIAEREAPDFFLLLNDDTHLYPGALGRMLQAHRDLTSAGERRCLVVGSTLDPSTGRQSYGGWRRGPRLNPGAIRMIEPGPVVARCDTMNGNCVLLPRDVFERVGNLDAAFRHSMGDIDYGFRARRAGCALWVAPGFVGECLANTGTGLWAERSLGGREMWRRLLGPKGLAPAEWAVLTSRHFGPFWPAHFAWPYLKAGWRAIKGWFASE